MKDDLDKYISRRKKCDGKFVEHFESGYHELKLRVLRRQASESMGFKEVLAGARK